jgi:5-methylthioadenosine/S-adenosylhomocysteine deaminase
MSKSSSLAPTRGAPIVIHDTTVISGSADGAVLHGVSVVIEGDRIRHIVPASDATSICADGEVVNGIAKAVAPGFANCHTHLSRVLARGIFEDQNAPNKPPFSRAGFLPFPKMTSGERDAMVRLAALEAIRSGTTLLMEVGSGIAEYADLLSTTGLRLVLAEQVSDRAGDARVGEPGPISFDPLKLNSGLRRIEALHANWHGRADGRVTVAIAPHAPDLVSPELFGALFALQARLDVLATVHLNQYWGEVAAIKETFGRLPTEHLDALGYLSKRLVAVHCRCMTPREEEILGRRGVTVCYTPAVTARAGNSARIGELSAAGSPIVLGTDEFAEDMVEVMRLSILLERVRRMDSLSPTPRDAWHWATASGYRALDVGDGGTIKPGAKADLIILGLTRAHLVPTTRIGSAFVHQGQASDVESVMVDGRWLMRDRKVLTLDEDHVLAEAERVARVAWARSLRDTRGVAVPADLQLAL